MVTPQATPEVGEDIEDTCTRCGDVWHVVMAKIDDRIAKVVCKRCGSKHSYRGDPGEATAAAAPTAATVGRKVVRKKTRPTAVVPVVAPPFDPNVPPRTYSPREPYSPGERINHPTFGTGVVATTPGPGKVEVVFPEGNRTLACAKAESKLERPVAISNAPIGDRPPQDK
jgi:ribosomal protein S27AE